MEFERVIKSRLVSTNVVLDVVAGSWFISVRRALEHVVVNIRGLIPCMEDCLGLHFN